ncbi:MAG: hypothetical protein JGK33_11870 [Microcoleus sp. PH2017_11_PCY_U_A]|nr:hypothetical protein [Microcoleus sp. PH2017_11_PCY_U_A]
MKLIYHTEQLKTRTYSTFILTLGMGDRNWCWRAIAANTDKQHSRSQQKAAILKQ